MTQFAKPLAMNRQTSGTHTHTHTHTHTRVHTKQCVNRKMLQWGGIKRYTQTENFQQMGQM